MRIKNSKHRLWRKCDRVTVTYKQIILCISSLFLLCLLSYLHVAIGIHFYSLSDIIKSFLTKESEAYTIISTIRIPRTITVIIAGMALSIAGFLSQVLTRNPIATPQVLGINSLVVFLSVFIQITVPFLIFATPFISLSFVFIFSLIIAFLQYQTNQNIIQISLIGMAFNLIFVSFTQLIIFTNEEYQEDLFFWLVGGVSHATWQTVITLIPYSSLSLLLVFLYRHSIHMLIFDEEMLETLGVSTKKIQSITIVIIALFVVGVVSLCGPIAFVGLVVPHIVSVFKQQNFLFIVFLTGVFGSIFLLLADLLAKIIFFPQEIYVGVMSALIGSLFFFFILIYSEKVSKK